MRIRAATWNIERGGTTPQKLEGAIALLSTMAVDVLVVTEAKWNDADERQLHAIARTLRTDGATMLGRLATAPDTTCHIATFYNADLLSIHSYDVKRHGIWHVRSSMQLAEKGRPADETVRFVGLHGHPFDGDDRFALSKLNRGYARKRAVLMGDYNCTPASSGELDYNQIPQEKWANHAMLDPANGQIERDGNGRPITDRRMVEHLLSPELGFIDVGAHFNDHRPTNNPAHGPMRIDLILASAAMGPALEGYGQLGDPNPEQAYAFGDHRGVYADLNLSQISTSNTLLDHN